MTYTIRPLTEHGTGAEVTGIDLTALVDEAVRKALNWLPAMTALLITRLRTMTSGSMSR